mmetsp:Transcript_8055/g.10320  ORF Transcript_8055/g.10320 Transcript_8055/m.10320 type:complete len:186 (-) Transcript_8055:77-634(-)
MNALLRRAILLFVYLPAAVDCFALCSSCKRTNLSKFCRQEALFASASDGLDEETAKLLENAKMLLEKAKSDLVEDEAKKTQAKDSKKVMKNENKKASVTKEVMEDTGLITTDGELMAALSEDEEWSERSLLQMFDDETFDDEDDVNESVINRDVAASINAMRVRMDNGDFNKIFDARNRFIGENR